MDPSELLKRIKLTVIVHVIEARHLASKDADHLSDPFCKVSVFGRRLSTDTARNQVNVAWNQVFMFEDLEMTMEEFQRELVVLQVYNANTFLRNELIGQFSFGLSKVRNQPAPYKHQVYKRWLALTDPENPTEESGYLLATVTVLGPGDIPPAHERQESLVTQTKLLEDRVLRVPTVKRRGYNIMVKVFRGEHLPITDTWNKTCDPFVVIKFNGMTARVPHMNRTLTPMWNYSLTLPVHMPCFSDTIELLLYDFVRGQPDRLLGKQRIGFASLLGDSFPPSWFNFYGQVTSEVSQSGWVCDLVRSATAEGGATQYVGRVLMALNMQLTDSPTSSERPCAPIKGPRTTKYVLWVDVYRGSELPLSLLRGQVQVEVQVGPMSNTRRSDFCSSSSSNEDNFLGSSFSEELFRQENSVRFTASGENLAPDAAKNSCQFRAIELDLPVILDEDSPAWDQFYDIVINVYAQGFIGSCQRVGYIRVNPRDVWGMNNPPEWHAIKGISNSAGETSSAGQLLVSLSFGTAEEFAKIKRQPMQAKNGINYQLRAYVYSARELRASNKDGLCNSYVQVMLGGRTARLEQTSNAESLSKLRRIKDFPEESGDDLKQTSVCRESLSPLWYETLVIDDVELPTPLSLAPDIDIRICDDNLSSGDYVGRCKFPTALCTREAWPVHKRPIWLRLAKQDLSELRNQSTTQSSLANVTSSLQTSSSVSGNTAGNILIKLELIPVSEIWSFPIWAHVWPRVIPCEINLGSIGLRQLEEYGFFGSIDRPYVKLTAQSVPNMNAPVTIASRMAQDNNLLGGNEAQREAKKIFNRSTQSRHVDAIKDENKEMEDEFSLAKYQEFASKDVIFLENQDVQSGKLSSKWTNASLQISQLVSSVLRRFVEAETDSNLFHPIAVKHGVVTWTNRANEKEAEEIAAGEPERRRGGGGGGGRSIIREDKESNGAKKENEERAEEVVEEEGFDDLENPPVDSRSGNSTEEVDPVEVERKRRTFFEHASLIVNMPLDPFYAPSITIQVMDQRFLGDQVIATATIPTPELCSYLYSGALLASAKRREPAFEMPRFAHAEAAKDMIKRYLDQQDKVTFDFGEGREGEESTAAAEDEEEKSNQLEAKQHDEEHEDEKYRDGDARNDKDFSRVAILTFDKPAEGHFGLPSTVVEDIEAMNSVVDESVLQTVKDKNYQIGDTAGLLTTRFAWPAQNAREVEINERANRLEEIREMQPAPFRSFPLFRGIAPDVMRAGIFKACIAIRPYEEQLRELHHVLEDLRPAKDKSGKVLQTRAFQGVSTEGQVTFPYIPLTQGETVRILDRAMATTTSTSSGATDNNLVLVERVVYRPDQKSRYLDKGLCSVQVLEPLKNPVHVLDDFPDHVSKEAKIKPMRSVLLEPQKVKVRVYVVACSQLSAKSLFQNKSDPYVVVQLNVPPYLKNKSNGVTYFNDRANYKSNALDPFFGAMYELDCTFPDFSELEVQIWNANYVSDDLIGLTKIDLEDRWFNPQWHQLKFHRQKIKEYRPLSVPGSAHTTGILEMWIEMYRPEDAINSPIVDIRLPQITEWELRLVVWETRRIPLYDDHDYANLYITGEFSYSAEDGTLNQDQYHETDSHTGLVDGHGIYNFRMKFNLQAPCKFPRLKLKVWERWLISHTALAEATIDLSDLVTQCSITQDPVIDRARRWVPMTHPDWPGQKRGDLDIQMSCVTRRYATANPVGNARDPPNENPYLPDPPRESIFKQLVRSIGYGKSIGCALCCVLIIVIIIILVVVKPL